MPDLGVYDSRGTLLESLLINCGPYYKGILHFVLFILRGCAHGRAAQAEARGEQFLSILRPLNSLKISKRLRLLNPLKVSKHFQAPKLPSNL